MENGRLKIRLTAPPVDGAANDALVRFLAERLSIAKTKVEIISGHKGRVKVIGVNGMSSEAVERILNIKRE